MIGVFGLANRNDGFGESFVEQIRPLLSTIVSILDAYRNSQHRDRAEAALRESEERYAIAATGSCDGLWDWNLKTDEIYYSTRWKNMLGYTEEEIANHIDEWLSRVHPMDLEKVKTDIGTHIDGLTPHFENEHRMLHADGTYRWVLSRGYAVRDSDGGAYRMAGSQSDVTDRKVAVEQLLHDAFHDGLTGLPNRALFVDRLSRSIGHTKRRERYRFSVLLLDLDRFKLINESLGHTVGDQLLIGTARRLEACLRPGDTVARLGGDEFAILLDDIKDENIATRIATHIHDELNLPFYLSGHEVFSNASIGITTSVTGYEKADDILRDADTALYRAKSLGKACYVVFDKGMHAGAVALLQLETDLRRALERNEILVYYQPVISFESGKPVLFEALVRWKHPERGLVLPDKFIPVAEETGMIVPIGLFVLREACRQTVEWQKLFNGDFSMSVSVNLSGKQFYQPDLVESINQICQETRMDPHHLCLEITESVIMQHVQSATSVLLKIKDMGIKLYMDDFGTGYSSLSYLHRFPFDTLKIDRMFISRMDINEENPEIIRTIIAMAHNLKLQVVAEGVETLLQYQQLKKLKCDYAQGYYMSKPVPPEQILEFISKKTVW